MMPITADQQDALFEIDSIRETARQHGPVIGGLRFPIPDADVGLWDGLYAVYRGGDLPPSTFPRKVLAYDATTGVLSRYTIVDGDGLVALALQLVGYVNAVEGAAGDAIEAVWATMDPTALRAIVDGYRAAMGQS